MTRKKKSPQFSACISNFCQMANQAIRDYEWNQTEVERLNRLTQDYLHKLELEDADCKERSKTATQLARCRQLRRQSKDTVEILEPFVTFLNSDKGRNVMNLMREALGKTRRVEERMVDRVYRYKELDEGEISSHR